MHQAVISLPLAGGLRTRLCAAGISTVLELRGRTPHFLAAAAGISLEEAQEALQAASQSSLTSKGHVAGAVSASDLLAAQQPGFLSHIITFCAALDGILGGGVACGQVTEFCGVPGVGKTQIGMQLAVDAQIPTEFYGMGGGAVYIDTEGSFMVDRVVDIAAATARHIQQLASNPAFRQRPLAVAQAQSFTTESILQNIHYFRVHSVTEQIALVNVLPEYFSQNPNVCLLVVDSITFHYRQDVTDLAARARQLTRVAQDFMALAERHNLAVVFTNQVTTRILENEQAKLVPALGESWGQAASTRVILNWQGNQRFAYIHKSPSMPPAAAPYKVGPKGIR
ncbi:DNA repair protein RAD51 3 [Dunaliella salina]|uniref:DNA repair protein RAD51 homolog 3 n=1 Tax=Dunaliella salina TaxID=3046 RepID=A0ABQ7GH12_DUNSA|nr:DNA repair protein RAD51 3 [Dunaliella salina]|eukprot:KAF5833892.1 DNA repair protein RAD51 3 [Dunaliella salina]